MAGGTKRSAEESGPATRASKVAKNGDGATPTKATKGGKKEKGSAKKGAKAKAIPTSEFKSKALPLHVNLTHTPPSIADPDDDTTKDTKALDPGHLGSVTLVPTSFATGSYGWKGNRRMTVELENAEGGKKEKVTVMLTINATVMGSKGAKEGDEEEDEEKEEKDGEEADEE